MNCFWRAGIAIVCFGNMIMPFSAVASDVFYAQGPRDRKAVALTFDDGPGASTGKVLEILKKYHVRGTFFMEGSQVDRYPARAHGVMTEGHEIANHTYSHVNFYTYKNTDGVDRLIDEIDRGADSIRRATGVSPVLVRIPHGYSRSWAKAVAAQKMSVIVNWTFGCDWKKMPVNELQEAYIKNIQPGAIFLMHDGGGNRQRTVDALPGIIEELLSRGYEIVPVSELIGLKTGETRTSNGVKGGR